MPVQAPQWTDFLSCPICYNEFECHVRRPISLGCGHTMCKSCLSKLQRKHCPFDQTAINSDINQLPENHALLQLVGGKVSEMVQVVSLVPQPDHQNYLEAKKCIEDMALYLKPIPSPGSSNGTLPNSSLSRSMQRKLVTLINCQLVEDEGRSRGMRAARSLGERSVTELILQHQNPQQLSANLWAAVRARGCQFLGPAMQEEVLKLVLLALEDGSALSRKVLVMFVVQRLAPHFPQASKTSIGHVVQLLYRASCFMVSKRDGDSSLMQLKEEFCTYEALRREHDAQIVQIATEAGLRIAPEQWSSLLYGDTTHKSHMQSIIDKLQTPQSFSQSVQELVIALQRTGDPGNLSVLRPHLELLAGIDSSPDAPAPSWESFKGAQEATRVVVKGLIDFLQNFGNRRLQEDRMNLNAKYKTSMCRDLTQRRNCPRGLNCTFAHSQEELEKFRSKGKRGNGGRSSGSDACTIPESGLSQDLSYISSSPEGAIGGSDYGLPNFVYDLPYISDSQSMVDMIPSDSSNIHLCNTNMSGIHGSPPIIHSMPQTSQLLNPNTPAFQPLSTKLLQATPSSSKMGSSLNHISLQSTMPPATKGLPKNKIPQSSKRMAQPSVATSLHLSSSEEGAFSAPCNMSTVQCKAFVQSPQSYTAISQMQLAKYQSLAALQQRKKHILAQLDKTKRPRKQHFVPPAENGGAPPCAKPHLAEGEKAPYFSPWSAAGLFPCSSSSDCEPPSCERDHLEDVEMEMSDVDFSDYALFCPSEKDEFIPFDRPLVSKYGPISRCSKRMLYGPAPIQVNAASPLGELTSPTSAVQHPLPSSALAPSYQATSEAATSYQTTSSEAVPSAVPARAAAFEEEAIDKSLNVHELMRSQELSRLLEEELCEVEKMIRERRESDLPLHKQTMYDLGGKVPTSIGPWPSETLENLPFKQHADNLPREAGD